MTLPTLYSIGYATKTIDTFIAQLNQYNISAVADVRSVPYSKRFYDFHQEALNATLKQAGIHYVYLGEELGPRSNDDAHYNESQQVQFDRLMHSPLYLKGIERLQAGQKKGLTIALMCAEKDPADCHRSLLIAYHLQHDLGATVQHIRHDGNLESQIEMESRLALLHNKSADLFASQKQQKTMAYKLQTQLKAYRRPSNC